MDVLQVVLTYVVADVLQVVHIIAQVHVEDVGEDVEIAIKIQNSHLSRICFKLQIIIIVGKKVLLKK